MKPLVPLTLGLVLLSGCASTPSAPPPAFNPALDAASQVPSFIQSANTKTRGDSTRVALTSCVVAFGTKTSGFAQTKAGTFAYQDPDKARVEAKVSTLYQLEGLSDAQLQSITDAICARAEQQLVAHRLRRGDQLDAGIVERGQAALFTAGHIDLVKQVILVARLVADVQHAL